MAIKTLKEIEDFIRDRETRYLQILTHIKDVLRQYHDYVPEGRRVVYRVASRGDYQQGKELKKTRRIQQKIKERQERQKKEGKKVTYSIRDIGDIIGTRLVCVYPLDVDVVRDFIRSENGKSLKIIEDKEVKKKSGYRAHHFTVKHSDSTLSTIKCEIQIVTILFEAWSFKEHRLIYEKEGGIKGTHGKRSELLSDALAVLDRQTEVLAEEIEEELVEEERKKTATRLDFMKKLATTESDYENTEQKESFQELKKVITDNEEQLRYSDPSEILGSLEKHKDHFGVNEDLCCVIGLLAVVRDSNDVEEIALTCADELIDLSSESKKASARKLRSFMLFGFGRTKKALEEAERALKKAEEFGDKKLINSIKANIAYFIAELGDRNRENQARKYICDARDPKKGGKPQGVAPLDTEGYVKIIFGKDFKEIEEGLRYCRQASAASGAKDKKVADSFYKIHQYKAYKRLFELCR